MTTPMHPRAVSFFQGLQDRICAGLEQADGGGQVPRRRLAAARRRRRPDARPRRGRGVREGRGELLRGVRRVQPRVRQADPRRRARRSPPPACRWCCTRAARWCRPSTPTSASSRTGSKAWFGGGARPDAVLPLQGRRGPLPQDLEARVRPARPASRTTPR